MVGILATLPGLAQADEVLVAVAANFLNPFREVSAVFEQATTHKVLLSPGSSGKLYAQIQNGAPFELFLSADRRRPRLLEEGGLAVKGSGFTYAIGRLVLWSREATHSSSEARQVLTRESFAHLAVANPKTAPYGMAAVQVMKKWGIWEQVRPRVVQGENIAQAFQFVASGNAEVGFVALSQVLDPRFSEEGTRWDIPTGLYDPLRQDAVLLEKGRANPAATALLEFLKGKRARSVITRYGYGLE